MDAWDFKVPSPKALVDKVTLEVFNRVVARTPYKTGNAMRHWFVKVNNKEGHITNEVPYINRLEHGWSNQAPNGMVAITMVELPQIIDMILKDEKNWDKV